MPAYCLIDINQIHDEQKMTEYRRRCLEVLNQFEGRFVVVGGPVITINGHSGLCCPLLIEFPSMGKAQQWFDSKEYQVIQPLLHASSECSVSFLEGL